MQRLVMTCASALILLAAGSAWAHHAPILFDRAKRVALTGTVAEFAWMNPHASIQLDVTTPAELKGRWGVEMNSPNNLVKDGWKSNLVKAGDMVTVVVNPLRAGEHGGIFVSIKLADGRVLGDRWTEEIESKGTVSPRP
jgi:hypothetical protein